MNDAPRTEPPTDATASARQKIGAYWDDHVARWLAGEDPRTEPLQRWLASYHDSGAGMATCHGLVEPYTGDLLGHGTTPRVVILGLSPGEYHPTFQARDGLFADEIREHGSYSRWMTTGPYLRPPWTTINGTNRYQQARLTFTQRWLDEPAATHADMLIFEMYPWHSTLRNAVLRAPADIIDQFVWQPIAELPIQHVFAFGRSWHDLATNLGLPLTDSMGRGGRAYGSSVPGRAIRSHAMPSGQQLIAEWHPGSSAPPSAAEVAVLKTALTGPT